MGRYSLQRRGDLIETYKVITGKERIDSEQFQKATTIDPRGQFQTLQEKLSTGHKKILLQPKSCRLLE